MLMTPASATTFSTLELPPDDRIAHWQEHFRNHYWNYSADR